MLIFSSWFVGFQNHFSCEQINFDHGILPSFDSLYLARLELHSSVDVYDAPKHWKCNRSLAKWIVIMCLPAKYFAYKLHIVDGQWLEHTISAWQSADGGALLWFKVFANVRFTPRMGGNIGLFVCCMMCISFVDHSKYFCIERQISFDGVTYANNQNKNTILCNMLVIVVRRGVQFLRMFVKYW